MASHKSFRAQLIESSMMAIAVIMVVLEESGKLESNVQNFEVDVFSVFSLCWGLFATLI